MVSALVTPSVQQFPANSLQIPFPSDFDEFLEDVPSQYNDLWGFLVVLHPGQFLIFSHVATEEVIVPDLTLDGLLIEEIQYCRMLLPG